MYAVVQTGGKQYRITAGSVIEVEKLAGDAGENLALNDVLALSGGGKVMLGSPLLAGASVEAQIIKQGKGDKVIIFKKKRRHNYRRKNGHRQFVTTLHITKILFNGAEVAKAEPRALKPVAGPTPPSAKKAALQAAKPVAEKKAAAPAAKKAAAPKKPAAEKKPAAAKKPAAKKPAAKKAE
jgi:large subunit ribosomal protein L21